jgi:penicillin-insensitive murein endopeptidase
MKKSFLLIYMVVFQICQLLQSYGEEAQKTQSIGYYTAGCIENAVTLPADGEGFQVIRLSRNRYYGHPELINYIKSLGRAVSVSIGSTILIGDLSQRNGGPMPDEHNSHQNGLDVDILLWQHPFATKRLLTPDEREHIHPVSLLTPDNKGIDGSRWHPIYANILKLAALSNRVERIFVNPFIKRKLCQTYRNEKWLRKIRPWWGHDGHFHVRLRCPDDSPLCKPQPPISDGIKNGCDSDLNQWFTKEGKVISRVKTKETYQPRLPKECLKLLEDYHLR